jgi:hypothetical protein
MQGTLGSLRHTHNNDPRRTHLHQQIHAANKLLNRNLTDPARLARTSKPPLRQRNNPKLSKAPSPHNVDTTARPRENEHPDTRTQLVGAHQNSLDPTGRLAPRQHALFAHSKAPAANGFTI